MARSKASQVQTSTETGGKLPPQNISAERSLLGSVLIDDEVLVDIADKITAKDFYEPAHQEIFAVYAACNYAQSLPAFSQKEKRTLLQYEELFHALIANHNMSQ